jgi:hypothetical protein
MGGGAVGGVFFKKKSEEIKVGTWPINIFEPELITLAP